MLSRAISPFFMFIIYLSTFLKNFDEKYNSPGIVVFENNINLSSTKVIQYLKSPSLLCVALTNCFRLFFL